MSAKSNQWKQELISGYHEFRAGAFRTHKERYSSLGREGQHPKTLIISCADSRVNPAAIFNADPGELFTLRNVANIVPPYDTSGGLHGASATIEYAVKSLEVQAIVILGHESCGGVKAYLEGLGESGDTDFIGTWIQLLDAAYQRIGEDKISKTNPQKQLEFAGVMQSLDNLSTFPFVADAIKDGKLSLLGAYFSIIQGVLMFADEDGIFHEVSTA